MVIIDGIRCVVTRGFPACYEIGVPRESSSGLPTIHSETPSATSTIRAFRVKLTRIRLFRLARNRPKRRVFKS
jgi:hypothetical protein